MTAQLVLEPNTREAPASFFNQFGVVTIIYLPSLCITNSSSKIKHVRNYTGYLGIELFD